MLFRSLLFLLVVLFSCCTVQSAPLPFSFDLRNIDGHSFIGPVRNQGACGSCWSFSALAAAESSLNRANGWDDGQTIDLSEAFLVWSLSPLSDHDGMAGCDGGIMEDAMTAMLEYGAPLEAEFPYLMDEAQNVIDPGQNLHWDAPRYTLEDWYSIPFNDIETTRRVLHSIGAVSIAAYSGNDAWHFYQDGVFEDDLRTPTAAAFATIDHGIALVGWNDEPGDGGMGTWVLRNSWPADIWGEDGYMQIRYLSSWSNLEGLYMIAEPWSGEDSDFINTGSLAATAWSAGGTLNAHGVDLWGAAASSVTNHGEILAETSSTEELVTTRGVYLWGGPAVSVDNAGDIKAAAYSQSNQAFAYSVNLQGGSIENRGVMSAAADSGSDLAMAYGIWAANGNHTLSIVNSGDILARTGDGSLKMATGVFSDNRELTVIDNQGSISAVSGGAAAGILLNRGPGILFNNGDILAVASTSELFARGGWGVLARDSAEIVNSGTISGSSGSIYSRASSQVTLTTGSDLIGPVYLFGSNDILQLTGTGSEDENFHFVEHLVMDGLDWTLSGDSEFHSIDLRQGRFSVDGGLAGQTRVYADGMLGGSGSLTGNVTSNGVVAPGHSVGHLTIDGDYAQTVNAALVIEIGDQEADRLTVTGSADLAGSLVVQPDGYASGGHYTFLEAGDLAGQFNRLQSVAVLDAGLIETPSGNLALEITRNSYASLATPPSLGLATNLDRVRAAATGDFGDLLDQLDLAADDDILNADLAAMTPRIHSFAGAAALADSQSRLSDLRRHLGRPTSSAGEAQKTAHRMTAWIDLPAGYTRYHSGSAYPAATEKLYGLMLGIERETPGGITAGLAVAVTENDYRFRDTDDDGESQSQQGYLYGRWRNPQRWGSFQLDAAIGIGRTELTAQRAIEFAGRKAHSEHDGRVYSATMRGRLSLPLDNWRFSPALGVSYVRLAEEGFRETGADSADLEIRSRQGDSLQSLLGFDMEHPLTVAGVEMNPALQIEWRHEFEESGASLHSKLRDGDEYFTSPGRDLADDSLLLGTTLRTEFSASTYAAFSYGLLLQSGNNGAGHSLALQLGMVF